LVILVIIVPAVLRGSLLLHTFAHRFTFMHYLIASYLFQNKSCPLPGLGTLWVSPGKAETDFLNTVIKAPSPRIVFEPGENDPGNLVDYIAGKTNRPVEQIPGNLAQFCDNLKTSTTSNKPAALNGVGNFFIDSSGKINFRSAQLPNAFLQPVKAVRVIHPEAEHQILVGDKETTNIVMNEYFNEAPVKKNRWWIWAIVLAVLALLIILLYLNNTAGLLSMAGNAMPIQ
jgi:hypothetical protein